MSEIRDQEAAENFFAQAVQTTDISPAQVTTDKEPALYPAIETVFDKSTKHRDSKYMNNRIEQNHRAIKSRYRSMKGFKDFFSALIFCAAFEEIRQFFRVANKTRAQRRKIMPSKISSFQQLLTKTN